MHEIEVGQAARAQLLGDEEAHVGESSVDGEFARDGAAVRQAKLNAGDGTNSLLQSRRSRRLRCLGK